MKHLFFILLLLPFNSSAQRNDTSGALKKLMTDFAAINNLSYTYTMDARFPNGDKDHVTGTIYLNTEDNIYYSDCPAFTMICTDRWFYKADHNNKTLAIFDLNKGKDKKLRKVRQKTIFKKGVLMGEVDSFLLKNGVIKSFSYEGNSYRASVRFREAEGARRMDITYDTLSNVLVSCRIEATEPWQSTASGKEMEISIACKNFKKAPDRNMYSIDAFFSSEKNKIALKKYNSYKLITKI